MGCGGSKNMSKIEEKEGYLFSNPPHNKSCLVKTILWVDPNINNEENQNFRSEINRIYGITVEDFTEINSLFEKMKSIKFEFDIVIIIISGKLIGDYLKLFKEQIYFLNIIPIHVIFTYSKDFIKNLLKNNYSEDLNNDLINIKNIASTTEKFENLLNKYLEDEQSKISLGNLEKPKDYNDCYSFEYIERSEQLIFPHLYKKIMENTKVSHSEIKDFNVFLLNNFGKEPNINELISKLIKAENIYDEIIAKCWARVYTFETSFYSNLNWNLMQLKNKKYNSFIQILYSGLKKYSYKDTKSLFRGSIISNDEMKIIEELYDKKVNSNNSQSKVMIYSRGYLSFSLKEDLAKSKIMPKEGYSSVLFEVLNNEKNKNSNAILSSFSDYPEEEEILFFPFSSFCIKDIFDEKENLKRIILEYLGIYDKEINERMKSLKNKQDLMNNIYPKSTYAKDVFISKSILNENNMNQNYKKESFSEIESKFIEKIIEISLNINSIICEYDIKEDIINKPIQILNSYEEVKRKNPVLNGENNKANEKEIKENCEIFLNNKIIDFCYECIFEKKNKNKIEIISKTSLKNTNFMFYGCSSLTSLNFSNFNTNNVNDMNHMFSGCSSLTSLDLSNFNTNNVKDMNHMFFACSSLTSLDLSYFNTNNVKDMSYMFFGCSSLTSLNLSNFNTNNVKNMNGMFSECSSLTSLNTKNERILEKWEKKNI